MKRDLFEKKESE